MVTTANAADKHVYGIQTFPVRTGAGWVWGIMGRGKDRLPAAREGHWSGEAVAAPEVSKGSKAI